MAHSFVNWMAMSGGYAVQHKDNSHAAAFQVALKLKARDEYTLPDWPELKGKTHIHLTLRRIEPYEKDKVTGCRIVYQMRSRAPLGISAVKLALADVGNDQVATHSTNSQWQNFIDRVGHHTSDTPGSMYARAQCGYAALGDNDEPLITDLAVVVFTAGSAKP